MLYSVSGGFFLFLYLFLEVLVFFWFFFNPIVLSPPAFFFLFYVPEYDLKESLPNTTPTQPAPTPVTPSS